MPASLSSIDGWQSRRLSGTTCSSARSSPTAARSRRARRAPRRFPTSSTAACATRSACRRSTRTSARPGTRPRAASTWSSRPAPRPGKTLAFNLPVLDALAREPKNRALYLYPTKALAQDQFRTLSGYGIPRLRPAIYDGDTPAEQRWQIRALRERDPDQPGHAPRRRAAAPRPLGRRAREPPLRRRRRGARLPRRVRLARRQRAAAAAAARADLRRRPALPARLGDDLEPRRARRRPARRCR